MSNLKENLIKRCDEMLEFQQEKIGIYREHLSKIPSGRNKVYERELHRSETLKQFWENLRTGLKIGEWEK